ncbi:MAG: SpoVA/SpoVAEb family sporulation membrane protein [Erysipelotrichaceae bacterium]|nr:SpoVA/SpoVAEb family sporulation membrane protein [Erysipelotrichaceae bacterium]
MNYFYAFLCCGFFSLIGQLLYDHTRLTPGHITSLFVILGICLDFFHFYDWIIVHAQAGALLPITSFGHSLVHSAMIGVGKYGFIGIFSNLFERVSSGLAFAILIAFLTAIVFKPKS